MTEAQEHLILKYLQENLSPEEKEIFESWINESEQNREAVDEMKKVWAVSADSSRSGDFQHDEEWNRLASAIQETPVIAIGRRSYLLKIAAAVILFIVASGAIYLTVLREKEIIHETTGQIEKIVLPDGSEVWLNQNSKITYSTDFSEDRNLDLKGEAFFDVKPNPEKPFVITTDGAQVKVLGTSFNVRAYADEGETEVFVATGRVSLSATNTTEGIVLTPGSNGVFSKKKKTIVQDNADHSNALAWKEKRLVFRKATLKEVIKTLKAYFKTDIQVQNENLLNCRFTGSFNDPTLEEVLETVRLSLSLEVDSQSSVYTFKGEGCNTN